MCNFRIFPKLLHFGKIPRKIGQIQQKFSKSWQILQHFVKISKKNSANFNEKIEIRERCKGVHCVDLGESFPTSIYLQKSASIQPRTSRSKFGSQITVLITYRASCSPRAVPGRAARVARLREGFAGCFSICGPCRCRGGSSSLPVCLVFCA